MEWTKATEPIVEVELSESSKGITKDIIEEMKSRWCCSDFGFCKESSKKNDL
ncbi:hypothetical protein JHU38_08265 [Prevotella sp. A2931]|uniref:Uncharacterized protein n=1 Tax=Prevotella illustrans TaxID=2800387 RepID=A0ABS3M6J6_9BACT|nr:MULTISPECIES: hypothetical protein [Prevotella]MBO1363760.1 hypothetical protein [Prevotella illustrans]